MGVCCLHDSSLQGWQLDIKLLQLFVCFFGSFIRRTHERAEEGGDCLVPVRAGLYCDPTSKLE